MRSKFFQGLGKDSGCGFSLPHGEQILKVGRAFAIKESFRKFWDFLYKGAAENFQQRWHFWETHSRLKPFIEVAGTIRRHIDRIMNYFDHRISNAAIEGIN